MAEIRLGTSDLMEDIKFTGGIRIAPNLRDNDVLFYFQNMRKRLDWGLLYYRSSLEGIATLPYDGFLISGPGKQFSSYYLATLKYPLDRIRSFRATIGPRFDRTVMSSTNQLTIKVPDTTNTHGQFSLEYVYDNTTNPATNIWHGLRYKIYGDWFTQISRANEQGKYLSFRNCYYLW